MNVGVSFPWTASMTKSNLSTSATKRVMDWTLPMAAGVSCSSSNSDSFFVPKSISSQSRLSNGVVNVFACFRMASSVLSYVCTRNIASYFHSTSSNC